MNQSEFISTVAAYIKRYAPEYGIEVVSPIIAQAMLESGYVTQVCGQPHACYRDMAFDRVR